MTGLIRLNLKMGDYCSACGFKCCGECNLKGSCDSPSALCDSFPLLFDGFSPYGVLGLNGWGVSNRCHGLGIKVGELNLGDILVKFAAQLNSDSGVLSLSNGGVALSVIKASISEVPVYARYLFRDLGRP